MWVQDNVRTGAFAVRKVAGEVNPADPFTKHLPSRDEIHQLAALFGCECREGRAASAPLLRPHDVDRQKDGHLSDNDPPPSFTLAEAHIHDLSVLPHMHSEGDIEKMFPKIEAAPETASSRDWIPEDEDPAVGPARARRVLRDEHENPVRRERERGNRPKREHLIMPQYMSLPDCMRRGRLP